MSEEEMKQFDKVRLPSSFCVFLEGWGLMRGVGSFSMNRIGISFIGLLRSELRLNDGRELHCSKSTSLALRFPVPLSRFLVEKG